MKVAYIHLLPLEYYPPATNALAHFSGLPGWHVRVWTTENARGMAPWSSNGITVRRIGLGNPRTGFAVRAARIARWHLRAAIEIRSWKPDAIVAVEPHSLPAISLYYSLLHGSAPLFIHFHEYYSSPDYDGPGMRTLRLTKRVDADLALRRARWVSETNAARLRMMLNDNPGIRPGAGRVLPNYPPATWVERAVNAPQNDSSTRTRLVYVGSASLEDTFIGEIARWVNDHSKDYSLHVVGNNVADNVWTMLDRLHASNITTEPDGCPYDKLPELLAGFDVGLILYKGNTLNFVHNVPNKAIEYLAAGLEVWYPPEMQAMRDFRTAHLSQRLREIDFKVLPVESFPAIRRRPVRDFDFTCENALSALVHEIDDAAAPDK